MQTYLEFEKPIAELEPADRRAARDRDAPATSISMPKSPKLEAKSAKLLQGHLCAS